MNQKEAEKLVELFKNYHHIKGLIKGLSDGVTSIAVVKTGNVIGNATLLYSFAFTDKDLKKCLEDELKAVEDQIKKLGGTVEK